MDLQFALDLFKKKIDEDEVLEAIRSIKVKTIQYEFNYIYYILNNINNFKKKYPGISFENKINRLKNEDAGEYEKFRRDIIPSLLEVNDKINKTEELTEKLKIKIPSKVVNFINKNKQDIQMDVRVIKNRFIR